MKRVYYVVVVRMPSEFGGVSLLKEIEVFDCLGEARKKAAEFSGGFYRKVSKAVARRIAKITQWGLLPEDVSKMFK